MTELSEQASKAFELFTLNNESAFNAARKALSTTERTALDHYILVVAAEISELNALEETPEQI